MSPRNPGLVRVRRSDLTLQTGAKEDSSRGHTAATHARQDHSKSWPKAPPLNRSARLLSIGQDGQVLVSGTREPLNVPGESQDQFDRTSSKRGRAVRVRFLWMHSASLVRCATTSDVAMRHAHRYAPDIQVVENDTSHFGSSDGRQTQSDAAYVANGFAIAFYRARAIPTGTCWFVRKEFAYCISTSYGQAP